MMNKIFKHVDGIRTPPKLEAIETENGRRYILPNGDIVPSVTTILGHFKKKALHEWRRKVGEEEANRISRVASNRGTKFHKLAEDYFDGKQLSEIVRPLMPDMKQSFLSCLDEFNKIDNIHYSEATLYSEILGIAGRTDLVAEYMNKLSIIDFKTSRKEKTEEQIIDYFLQGTAYGLMYEELTGTPIEQVVIIMSSDGLSRPQVFVKNIVDYIDDLVNIVQEYKKLDNPKAA